MLDLGSLAAGRSTGAQRSAKRCAENLRLLYVALTRAKHRCSVVWGAFTRAEPVAALGYLLHQPPARRAETTPSHGRGGERIGVARRRRRCSPTCTALAAARRRGDRDRRAARGRAGGAVSSRRRPQEPAELRCRAPSGVLQLALAHVELLGAGGGRRAVSRAGRGGPATETRSRRTTPAARGAPRRARRGPARLPRRARPGQLVHEFFEHLDFTAARPEVLQAAGRRSGWRATASSRSGRSRCAAPSTDVLDTPLDAGAQRSACGCVDVPAAAPERDASSSFRWRRGGAPPALADDEQAMLSAARLAAAFARHAAAAAAAGLCERLRRLGFAPLAGFLRGFIDLVFEHAGRWYVVDYKSNRLGARPPTTTGRRRLADAMARHALLPAVSPLRRGAASLSVAAPARLRLRRATSAASTTSSCAAWRPATRRLRRVPRSPAARADRRPFGGAHLAAVWTAGSAGLTAGRLG